MPSSVLHIHRDKIHCTNSITLANAIHIRPLSPTLPSSSANPSRKLIALNITFIIFCPTNYNSISNHL